MEIGINPNEAKENAQLLNNILADEFVLYVKTRNFHWNVKGTHFNDFHKFFEDQYEEIDEIIDEVAERVRMLNLRPYSSLKEYLDNSTLKENFDQLDDKRMILELLSDHEKTTSKIRESIEKIGETKDFGTEDFLVALLQKHEKISWMLRSMGSN